MEQQHYDYVRSDTMVSEAYPVGEYVVEVYDNPSANLSLHAQEKLIRDCMPLAQNGFGAQHIDAEVVRQHVLRTSTSIVIRKEFDQVVGVAGSSVLKIDEHLIIYLQGAVISKECQDHGLYKLTVAARVMAEVKKIDEFYIKNNKVLIGTRTQNPLVYKIMHRKLKLFPYPNGYIDSIVKYVAKKFANKINEKFNSFQSLYGRFFDNNTFVAKGLFTHTSDNNKTGLNIYGFGIPLCKDDNEINQYMTTNVNCHRGDALIILGYFCQKGIAALWQGQNIEITPAVFSEV
jgi:hypothetical protein